MKTSLTIIVLSAVAEACMAATDSCFERLPFGCEVVQSDVLSGEQRDAIGQRLGVPLKTVSNTQMVLQGAALRVNIMEANTDEDAPKLHAAIFRTKNHPAFCLQRGRKVVEFCRCDAATAIKAAYELGFVRKPSRVLYRITAQIATIRTADYMAFNELCRAFFSTDANRPNPKIVARVAELSKGFTFGDSLALRARQQAGIVLRFTPAPVRTEPRGSDRVVYVFDQTPKTLGVPHVTLHTEIPCDHTGLTPTDRAPSASLLASTPYWPVGDPEVAALAGDITAGRQTPEAKVRAILEWLKPGRNIKSSGPTGSRWGVKKVLRQKFGHCWDASDCFVTLARAAGVPARQVGGWLFGTSGHIWAEVLVVGKGWQQVDPTGGGRLDCGIYHIPYFASEDGEMPILYVSLPRVEIVETQ
ncbi:MAG: transglutaminase-like domain-containing protein [Verrucomicrobiia bacterium]